MMMMDFLYFGYGIGLWLLYYEVVVVGVFGVDFFEVISENFMVLGGNLC